MRTMRQPCARSQRLAIHTPAEPSSANLGGGGDGLGFFREWLKDPLRVAAVAPSGRALARLMTSEISHTTGPVIELGPGTGSFTRALIERGVRQEDLALIEFGDSFAETLRLRYPDALTLCMDATRLRSIDLFGGVFVGATVSGLPLLSMAPRKVVAILNGAFAKMGGEGVFYQFTYGPRCPVNRRLLDRLGLEAHRIGGTLANVPPAAVYRIRRRVPVAEARADFPSVEDGSGPLPLQDLHRTTAPPRSAGITRLPSGQGVCQTSAEATASRA